MPYRRRNLRFDVLQLLSPSRFVSFCLCFGSLLAFPSLRASSSYLRYECHTQQQYYLCVAVSWLLSASRFLSFPFALVQPRSDIIMAVGLCVRGGLVRIRMFRVMRVFFRIISHVFIMCHALMLLRPPS